MATPPGRRWARASRGSSLTGGVAKVLDTDWRVTENNRRAKYYRLTTPGRRALGQELASWRYFVAAVEMVVGTP